MLRALARRKGPLALIHFDAHVDTWPDNFGQPYSHGSVFYHAIEERLIDPRRMIQIGIRSPVQREVFDWTLARGVTIITAEEVHEQGPKAAVARVHSIVGEAPCYLENFSFFKKRPLSDIQSRWLMSCLQCHAYNIKADKSAMQK